jgi:predicted DNA-binding protein
MVKRNKRNQSADQLDSPQAGKLAMRLDPPINDRFQRVVKASKRSKTSIVEECLERVLPELEKQYLAKVA